MKVKKIAVLFGGCSPEYGVSLESAYGVIAAMDRERYAPVLIGITREGAWRYFDGDPALIPKDRWLESGRAFPAALSLNRGEGTLTAYLPQGAEKLSLDAAFPVLHGQNGEDGSVQGLLQLSGIPLVGCGVLASALCMNKSLTHRVAKAAGAAVPEEFVLDRRFTQTAALERARVIGYPLFVKPVKAGSSYGVTKVIRREDLVGAVKKALQFDSRAIVEKAVPGFEVGCAIMGNQELTVGELDEIELSGGFFDYTEKYTLRTSRIHVPARISGVKAEEIKKTAKTVYRALGCRGFARVDMFLTPEGEIVLNEVNTIPGFTKHSRFPSMMRAAGLSMSQVVSRAIELALEDWGDRND